MGFTAIFILAIVGGVLSDDITLNPFVELKSNFEFLSETNLAESAYRLLDTVQPHHVYVDLDVYLSESRFDGVVTHLVTVQQELSQIVLHSNVVEILTVSIFNSANQPVPLNPLNSFEIDTYFEIIKINLGSSIAAGDYTISITYKGQINENPLDRGFYKGYYYLNNQKIYYATTQFQPFHARKAFPSFDEPQFKSRFVLSITRDANLSPSFSNMAINETEIIGNRIRETFLPTPIISAYLIAFHVSDFVKTTSTGTEAKPFAIISRRGPDNQHSYAAQIGLRITDELSDYLDFNYYNHGIDQPMKNDHIALPDFPSGAMENWGMVNYREAYLLYDEHNTNLNSKVFIATIMAHELAHKWFGNLVTCFWWSNLWLNESYASFFEYFAAHWADEELELADQFIVDNVHSALNWDAGTGATSMNLSTVENNPSVSGHFSTTSYAKGSAVLRMMEHFVGPRNFKNALRYYLKDNAYELGTPEKMYDAFRQAVSEDPAYAARYGDLDVGEVFNSWVQNPGSPVLNVDVNIDTGVVTINQERFLLDANATIPNHIWHVPVSWTHGGDPNFARTTPDFVLTSKTHSFQKTAGHDWVILNIAQSGLYRVNYDRHNWEMLASALRENVNTIHYLNRAQIVNDVLHFIRAEKIPFDLAFEVLSFLQFETNYYVWAGALGQLDIIRRRLEHIPRVHDEFHAYLSELMDHVIEELGYTERARDSTSTILNRMLIMNYACNTLGHQGCIDYSKQRWQQYRANDSDLVHKNERRYVYCVGLREGTAADYNWLFQKYNTSENTADMVVILRALGCTKDSASLNHYMEQSMYNDKIRIHDKPNVFTFALQGNPENIDVVIKFLYNRHREIAEWYGGEVRLNTGISAISTYLTDWEKLEEFHTWTYANQVELGGSFSTAQSVIRTARSNREWGNKIAPDFWTILRSRNSAISLTSPFILLVVTILAHLIH